MGLLLLLILFLSIIAIVIRLSNQIIEVEDKQVAIDSVPYADPRFKKVTYTREDWDSEVQLENSGIVLPCRFCKSRRDYGPRIARGKDGVRRYRACKKCLAWQECGGPVYYCYLGKHRCADKKLIVVYRVPWSAKICGICGKKWLKVIIKSKH